MSGFTMVTNDENIPISSSQKAAILFTELGSNFSSKLIPFLSDSELKKLRTAVDGLGLYSPKMKNFSKVQKREIRVLEEVCTYGVRKKYLDPSVLEKKDYGFIKTTSANGSENKIIKDFVDNPDVVTNVLRTWLNDE
jgi:Sec7-like guanine-nucleotide exchange factor